MEFIFLVISDQLQFQLNKLKKKRKKRKAFPYLPKNVARINEIKLYF